jgi:ABC-type protease/lipase transport system fused ATPase/permease subunit
MVKLGTWLDARLSVPVLAGSLAGAAHSNREPSVQGLRDLSTLRGFVTGSAVFPILDAPWTPLFLAVIFLLHPFLGLLAVLGAAILLTLALGNDYASRRLIERSGAASIAALRQAEAASRNVDTVMAMGLLGNLVKRWRGANENTLDLLAWASHRSGAFTAASKGFRLALQIAMLGLGAWLVIGNEGVRSLRSTRRSTPGNRRLARTRPTFGSSRSWTPPPPAMRPWPCPLPRVR